MDSFQEYHQESGFGDGFDQFSDVSQFNQDDITKEEDDLISYLAQYVQSPLPSPSFFSYSDSDGLDVNNRATVDIAYSDSDVTPNTPLTPYGRSHLHFLFPDVGHESQQPQHHHHQQQQQPQQQYHQQQQQQQNQQLYFPNSHLQSTDNSVLKLCTPRGISTQNANPSPLSTSNTFLPSTFHSQTRKSSADPLSTSVNLNVSITDATPLMTSCSCSHDVVHLASDSKQGKSGKEQQLPKKGKTTKPGEKQAKRTPGRKKCTASSPIELHKQRRLAANARERKRMRSLNVAFDKLRQVVPSIGEDQILSKYDTLQMAQTYITALQELLDKDPEDSPI